MSSVIQSIPFPITEKVSKKKMNKRQRKAAAAAAAAAAATATALQKQEQLVPPPNKQLPNATKPSRKRNKPSKQMQHLIKKQLVERIEKQCIERHIKSLSKSYMAPVCPKCYTHDADRLCISSTCRKSNYLDLICYNCHKKQHSIAVAKNEKPEILVTDYLLGLNMFLNNQSQPKGMPPVIPSGIHIDKLKNTMNYIDSCLAQLKDVEGLFENVVENYETPEEEMQVLEDSLNSILKCQTYENIQEKFEDIKTCVIFEENGFEWNTIADKEKYLIDEIEQIEYLIQEAKRALSSSYVTGRMANLEEVLVVPGMSQQSNKLISIKHIDDKIVFEKPDFSYLQQFYLDFYINPSRFYTMNFTVSKFDMNYFFIGLMKKSQVETNYIQNEKTDLFYKRFHAAAFRIDCSKVLRGKDIVYEVRSGSKFEMRFAIENQILQFSTYPDYENIVSKLDSVSFDPKEEYVITICMYNQIDLVIDSIEDSSFFPEY